MRNERSIDRPLYVVHGHITTPPMSRFARLRTGFLLRRLQQGEMLTMPESRPMPIIGRDCHELRVEDPEQGVTWRVIYVVDDKAIVVLEVFEKKTRATPDAVKKVCRERLRRYLDAKGN